MDRLFRYIALAIGIIIQVLVVLIFGFTEVAISSYLCVFVWLVGASIVFSCVNVVQ